MRVEQQERKLAAAVPKTTGTYADVLSAAGKASLVEELSGPGARVVISDVGTEYRIWASGGEASRAELTVGYRYLAVEKAPHPPSGIVPSPFPYAEERAKEEVWRKWQERQRAGRSRAVSGEERAESEPPAPEPRLELFKAIHSMQGSKSWNALALWLHSQVRAAAFVEHVSSRVRGGREELPGKPPSMGVVQAFSPAAGKGANRPKPDGAPLDNLKGIWLDWFEEWCKYRGVVYCLTAQFFGKDIKFAALLPGREIELNTLRRMADELVDRRWVTEGYAYSTIKHDVLGLLQLAEWLIQYSEFSPEGDIRYRFLPRQRDTKLRPRDMLAGVSVASFNSLGQARALGSTAELLLPNWFPISRETYQLWLNVLREHRRSLRYLREDIAEEANLLAAYRHALSANLLDNYLPFFASYGENLMRRRAQGDYREQFTVRNLKELIMALTPDENPSVRELIAEEGFERLAQAIHQATVQAQYWQEQKEPNAYEVCYGLAQRWKRAVERHEFVNELMDFVRAYNEENLKKKERRQKGKQYCRQDVLQSDLQTVLGYMDTRLSAATISLLLLAFGYAMTEDEKKRIEIARVAAAERRSAGVQAGQNAS